jgi:hypothetical protein
MCTAEHVPDHTPTNSSTAPWMLFGGGVECPTLSNPLVPEERCPSTDDLKDACIKTTTTYCSPACSALLNALPPANDDGTSPCMECLLEDSRKWGISDEFFCAWRSTCDVPTFPGINCGAPLVSAEETAATTEFRISIDVTGDVDDFWGNNAELKKWAKSMARAMTMTITDENPDGTLELWSYIQIAPALILTRRGRQLATAEMQVNVNSPRRYCSEPCCGFKRSCIY